MNLKESLGGGGSRQCKGGDLTLKPLRIQGLTSYSILNHKATRVCDGQASIKENGDEEEGENEGGKKSKGGDRKKRRKEKRRRINSKQDMNRDLPHVL